MARKTSRSFDQPLNRRCSSQSQHKNTSLSRRRCARQRTAKAKKLIQQQRHIVPPQLPRFDFEVYHPQYYLPAWCPSMPAVQHGRLPLFFDLSHLPEHKPARRSPPQRLKKQSKFFPPPTKGPEPAIKISHVIGNGGIEAPSAANLWNILSTMTNNGVRLLTDRDLNYVEMDDEDHGGVSVEPDLLGRCEQLQNIETFKTPYVHPNSLLGYANNTAASRYEDDPYERFLHDSMLYLAELFSPVDQQYRPFELAAMPSPLILGRSVLVPALTDSTKPRSSESVRNHQDAPINAGSDDLGASLAQYTSEQELFGTAIPLPESPTESECDLALTFSMGHLEDCWCCDCNEQAVLVEPEIESPLTEDDGWVVYAAAASEERVAFPASSWSEQYEEFDWTV